MTKTSKLWMGIAAGGFLYVILINPDSEIAKRSRDLYWHLQNKVISLIGGGEADATD